ncbi:hypothetical protein HZB93_00830 [Candidatus Falkowbacteria bacterium]|nr:hypothetical protein [Candidatus Falkowbacteria bacterium]
MASVAIIVFTVGVVGIADQIAPHTTVRLMQRFEPQLDRFVTFLLRE